MTKFAADKPCPLATQEQAQLAIAKWLTWLKKKQPMLCADAPATKLKPDRRSVLGSEVRHQPVFTYFAYADGVLKIGQSVNPVRRLRALAQYIRVDTKWTLLAMVDGHRTNEGKFCALLKSFQCPLELHGGRRRELFYWTEEVRKLITLILQSSGSNARLPVSVGTLKIARSSREPGTLLAAVNAVSVRCDGNERELPLNLLKRVLHMHLSGEHILTMGAARHVAKAIKLLNEDIAADWQWLETLKRRKTMVERARISFKYDPVLRGIVKECEKKAQDKVGMTKRTAKREKRVA